MAATSVMSTQRRGHHPYSNRISRNVCPVNIATQQPRPKLHTVCWRGQHPAYDVTYPVMRVPSIPSPAPSIEEVGSPDSDDSIRASNTLPKLDISEVATCGRCGEHVLDREIYQLSAIDPEPESEEEQDTRPSCQVAESRRRARLEAAESGAEDGVVAGAAAAAVGREVRHARCARCDLCRARLPAPGACLHTRGRFYCSQHARRPPTAECTGCKIQIHRDDMVKRAATFLFHESCFACTTCKSPLATGQRFYLTQSRRLVCETCKTLHVS